MGPITYEHVRLRAVAREDLPRIYEIQLNPEFNELAVAFPRKADAFEAHWTKVLNDASIISRVILVDNFVAGFIGCFKMEGLDSVGYGVDKEFWGNGIATS